MTTRVLHCHACTLTLANAVAENAADFANCPRCHAKLHYRRPQALARSSAT